jgi:hypothetical protein
VVTEVAGKLRFEDFIDGVTVQSKTDEVTGLASMHRGHRPQAAPGLRQGPAPDRHRWSMRTARS